MMCQECDQEKDLMFKFRNSQGEYWVCADCIRTDRTDLADLILAKLNRPTPKQPSNQADGFCVICGRYDHTAVICPDSERKYEP